MNLKNLTKRVRKLEAPKAVGCEECATHSDDFIEPNWTFLSAAERKQLDEIDRKAQVEEVCDGCGELKIFYRPDVLTDAELSIRCDFDERLRERELGAKL